jgi:pimeloyl-ACP methyl ester carboxylesterase
MFLRLVTSCALLLGGAAAPLQAAPVSAPPTVPATHATTVYKSVEIDGMKIFYREAGPPNAPTVLLLHGFPSSSLMFEPLMPLLADRYHVVAPDYPGFGHSDAPPPDKFAYTFANITDTIDKLTQTLGLKTYALYVTDYGGAVGMRLATAHPERVRALIVQNAAVHDDALADPRWAARKAFWADRAAHEEQVRAGMLAAAGARARHLGSSPHPNRYDPDEWDAEVAYMNRPGIVEIALDLFYDYRSNVAAFPAWQDYLRVHKPPLLVVWGKYDPVFAVGEADAFRRELPKAEIHVIDAGHFAFDEAVDQVAALTRAFLHKTVH